MQMIDEHSDGTLCCTLIFNFYYCWYCRGLQGQGGTLSWLQPLSDALGWKFLRLRDCVSAGMCTY